MAGRVSHKGCWYYSFAAFSFAKVSGDYQFINNPAYNRQRGPVSAFALRLHAEF